MATPGAWSALLARFAAVDLSFLRVLSAEQSLTISSPASGSSPRAGVDARAIVLALAVSPGLDVVARTARRAGRCPSTGRHRNRDARALVRRRGLAEGRDRPPRRRVTVPYRVEGLPRQVAAAFVAGPASSGRCPTALLAARRGLGMVIAAISTAPRPPLAGGRRRPPVSRPRAPSPPAPRSGCSGGAGPAAHARSLLMSTPGLDLYLPVTDNVAIAAAIAIHPKWPGACPPTDFSFFFFFS
jgi:hypothetical protein